MTTFVDTNVLIYLHDTTSAFHRWAIAAATERREVGPLVICDIVYSEMSAAFQSVEETNAVVTELAIERFNFTDAALFRAGQAFQKYKKQGGSKSNVLSDFLIGAQAETENVPLLTANQKDFKNVFPGIQLIAPTSPPHV